MTFILVCAIVGAYSDGDAAYSDGGAAYSDGGACSTEVAHRFLEDFCTPALINVSMYSSTLKKEAARSYDILPSTHRNTRRHIPYKPGGFG
jgi:hypothetical protein